MCPSSEQYETVCKDQFVSIHHLCGTPHNAVNAEYRIMQSLQWGMLRRPC